MAREGRYTHEVVKQWLHRLVIPLLGALVFVSLFGTARFQVDAFEIELSVSLFDSGRTEIIIPPIGRVSARTHAPPALLQLTLLNIDLTMLQAMIHSTSREQIIPNLQVSMHNIVTRYVVWLIALGMAGAVSFSFIGGQRRWRPIVHSAVIGTVSIGLIVAITLATFRVQAFAQPNYTGIISVAPWAVELLDQSFVKAKKFSDQMGLLAQNLYTLFERIDEATPIGAITADRKLLIVSDIHNNPIAMDFVERLVTTFRPDFIIDAGDLTDFGTPLEATLLQRIQTLPVPYVFVAGNHDSPAVIATIKELENGIVLEGEPVTVAGVTIIGYPDPSSVSTAPVIPSVTQLEEVTSRLEAILKTADSTPSILVVHNPVVSRRFQDEVPVLIAGHTHKLHWEESDNSLYLNPGTTGAAGIRGLQTTEDIPYSVALLYLDRYGSIFRAKAVDLITVQHFSSGLTLQRKVMQPPDQTPEQLPDEPESPL